MTTAAPTTVSRNVNQALLETVNEYHDSGDTLKYECCSGEKKGQQCFTVSRCAEFMPVHCARLAKGKYPKYKNPSRWVARGQLEDDFVKATSADLSRYTWLSDDFPGCACWDTDRAEFHAAVRQVALMDVGGGDVAMDLNDPSQTACWFEPCSTASANAFWSRSNCLDLEVCVESPTADASAGDADTYDAMCTIAGTTGGRGAGPTPAPVDVGDTSRQDAIVLLCVLLLLSLGLHFLTRRRKPSPSAPSATP